MQRLGLYIYPGFQMLDLAGPLGVFEMAAKLLGAHTYSLTVLSPSGGMVRSSGGVCVDSEAIEQQTLDTLLVVGGESAMELPQEHLEPMKAIALKTARFASVCTGAFLLSAVGLLDERRVTTHWRAAAILQQRYPAIKVEPDRIFIQDGHVWSSAGVTAGIDLALTMVEADYGADLAHQIARELVVYYRRSGGQSQFSSLSQLEPESDRIRQVLGYMQAHLAEPLPLERLAEQMHLSIRQFSRVFRQQTGETPARAVERLRAEEANRYLSEPRLTIAQIASRVGFSDAESMRRAFIRIYGKPPQAVRRQQLE